jgi:protein-L-isoaspartate(D-aspartate) O-methyltransferase
MAWRSSGATNRDLIENLWNNKLIKDARVKEAFLKVPPPLSAMAHQSLTCD